MRPNVPQMRQAAMDVEEMLERAVAVVEEGTPAEDAPRHDLATGYVALARAYLDRFEEAARGA